MDLSVKIIDWFNKKKRDLPWRETKDPYKIWISEIILQQTRVSKGIDYYLRFIRKFPDVHSLAKADLDQVMKQWQGLGYYSRARYLHEAACYIHQYLDGNLPSTYSELLKIKGIGEYSAAAIASLAYNEPVPLVDGNVFRVLSRLFMISLPKGTSSAKKQAHEIAGKIMNPKSPGLHNQAIMEFGAIQCTPKKPKCGSCVLNSACKAYSNQNVEQFPIRSKKNTIKNRYINYLVILTGSSVLIKKRETNDIWKGLYDFPSIEFPGQLSANKILKSDEWNAMFSGTETVNIRYTDLFTHLLSHQKIAARFFLVEVKKITPLLKKGNIPVPISELRDYPIPRLIERFLDEGPLAFS